MRLVVFLIGGMGRGLGLRLGLSLRLRTSLRLRLGMGLSLWLLRTRGLWSGRGRAMIRGGKGMAHRWVGGAAMID